MKTFVIAWACAGDAISMKQIEAASSLYAVANTLPDYYSLYLEHRDKDQEVSFDAFGEWLYDTCEIDINILEIQ